MSNFECLECGMTNIDCGKQGYKTPREIELEKENAHLKQLLSEVSEGLKVILNGNAIGLNWQDIVITKCKEKAKQLLEKIKGVVE